MAFVIDTCVWIDIERGTLAPGDVAVLTNYESIFLSPVTIAELKFGAESVQDPGIRQRRLAALSRLQHVPLLQIDGVTGEIFGSIAAQLKTIGRQHNYRVQDLWIASQAVRHSYRLLTANRRDFEDIPGLELVTYEISRRTKSRG
jgi:predicted nucleic acid-binding protein